MEQTAYIVRVYIRASSLEEAVKRVGNILNDRYETDHIEHAVQGFGTDQLKITQPKSVFRYFRGKESVEIIEGISS